MITDPFHTRIISGELVEGVPGVRGQLDLLGDTILGRLSALELGRAA
jgi:hypothetical protein